MGKEEMRNIDTICATATAPGGAIGIIRVSGPKAFTAVSSLCSINCNTAPANTVHYTHIVAPPIVYDAISRHNIPTKYDSEPIDEVLITIFRAPHSYTGENSVEISCHGSSYILQRVLDILCQQGCRIAQPGEFTMRAYLNGKLDLSQAEAVADLIASSNKTTHDIAMSQLRGHFSSELSKLRKQLLKLTSLIELELDFSDQEDLEFANRSELLALAQEIDNHITRLAKSFNTGQAFKQGISVAIVGKTNVGKSTLLNKLIDDDRAIVTDIHGTTRDTIEETMEINGVKFRIIDTAGIRQSDDEVERIGIKRTNQAIKQANIVIWLLDAPPSKKENEEMHELLKGKNYICVHNKVDKVDMKTFVPYFLPLYMISAKTGKGIPNLKRHIFEEAQRAGLISNTTEIIVSNSRHYESLINAHKNLQHVINGLGKQLSGDLLSDDLRLVLSDLGEITGEGYITSQETLNNIFSTFCVGK